MNVLIWNCKGALKPSFRQTVLDIVNWHHPIIMVITETRFSGDRAKSIMASLPFDGALCSIPLASLEAFGCFGGLTWFKWNCYPPLSRKFMPLFG